MNSRLYSCARCDTREYVHQESMCAPSQYIKPFFIYIEKCDLRGGVFYIFYTKKKHTPCRLIPTRVSFTMPAIKNSIVERADKMNVLCRRNKKYQRGSTCLCPLCAAPECDIIYDVRETHLTNRWKKCLLRPFVPLMVNGADFVSPKNWEKSLAATSFSFLRLYELVSDKGLRPHIKFFWHINAHDCASASL